MPMGSNNEMDGTFDLRLVVGMCAHTIGNVAHIVVLVDHRHGHEVLAGIRQRDGYGPRVEIEHGFRIERVA